MELLTWVMANGSGVDVAIFVMGLPVAYLAWHNMKRNKVLTEKYNQIDKLTLLNSFLLADLTRKKIVKIHRNGDYEIVNPLNQKD